MGCLIDEDEVLKILCRELCHPGAICPDGYCEGIREKLRDVPTAQPEQTEMIKEIRKWINSANRGNADYFIVDKIEEIINRYE